MPVLNSLIDVITMKSEKPMRRLLAYYGILAIIVLLIAYFAPGLLNRVAAKGLAEVSQGPSVLQDALSGNATANVLAGESLPDLAVTTALVLLRRSALASPGTWGCTSAPP